MNLFTVITVILYFKIYFIFLPLNKIYNVFISSKTDSRPTDELSRRSPRSGTKT